MKAFEEEVVCAACAAVKPKREFKTCSQCHTPSYCNTSCQRRHWKVHKRECDRLKEARKARRKEERQVRAKEEEEKAGDLMDKLRTSELKECCLIKMLAQSMSSL